MIVLKSADKVQYNPTRIPVDLKHFALDNAKVFPPIGEDENMIWAPIGQEEAMSKAENMLQLIGYPDWLPEEAELDAYYE